MADDAPDYLRQQVGTVTTFDQMLNTVADALELSNAPSEQQRTAKHDATEATHKR